MPPIGCYVTSVNPVCYSLQACDDRESGLLFTTSTKDDRVHPGHARKMVAKLQDQCDKTSADNVWYYENIEGGHSGAADNKQRAFMKTLEYQFLWDTLKSE